VVLAAMMSALVSAMLPGCRFPDYGMASGVAGASGGFASGGSSGGDRAGGSGEAGEAGSDPGSDAGAGAGGEGGMDIKPPPTPCGQICVPKLANWLGPMAFWEGQSTATLPPCPAGFKDPAPTDLHRDLDAPAGTCNCKCLAAEGQVCDTLLHISLDQNCGAQCAAVGTQGCTSVPASCTGLLGTTSIDAMTVSGGSCKSQVTLPAAPTWMSNGRLCKSSDAGACDDPKQVCARVPDLPYLSSLCVTRQINDGDPVPVCPAEYSHHVSTLYGEYTDNRGCSQCSCGAPTGGTCTGRIAIYGGPDCQNSTGEYSLNNPSNCQSFNLSGPNVLRPTHVSGQYTLSPAGTCSVTSKSEPTAGEAKPSGMVTIVCCQ